MHSHSQIHTIPTSYFPFGMVMTGREYSTTKYKYGFNAQEKDLEFCEVYNFKFRMEETRIGRFLSVDPLAPQYPWNSSYAFAENDVIRAIDLEGQERLIVIGMFSQTTRTAAATTFERDVAIFGFMLTHPNAAIQIGEFERGGTNITSVSGRIARHLAEDGNFTTGEGGESNAFRHGLWQATIANEFGHDIAEQAGYTHEGIKIAESFLVDFSQELVQDLAAADEIVDLLNNSITRGIQSKFEDGASQVEIAKGVLEVYKNEGLYEVVKKDGKFTLSKEKISENQYNKAIEKLSTLDNNGMNEEDRKDIEGE